MKTITILLYSELYEENLYTYHSIPIFIPIEVICSDRYMDYVSQLL
jgi:hypothetical protein